MGSDVVVWESAGADHGERRHSSGRGWSAQRARLIGSRVVLGLGVLLSALGIAIVLACLMNDRAIDDSRGEAVAEVLDTSLTRTVVRFTDSRGRVFIPANGVLYPSGVQEGQLVRVEYDQRNPEIVRVAGRNVGLALLPVGTSLAVLWALVLSGRWLLRRGL